MYNQSINGLYGFIDSNGKEVVSPLYSKILPFNELDKNIALVKSITGTYGIIDNHGNIIVQTLYDLEYIKKNYKTLLNQ